VWAVLPLMAFLGGCGGERDPLRVGGKDAPENRIVAEMLAEMASREGIPVVRRIGLGSTRLTLEALKSGEIDVFPEYTGTGLAMLGLVEGEERTSDETLERLGQLFAPLNLAWSKPLGFESPYGLAMQRETARALKIRTYSDLAEKSEELVLGVDAEFRTRPVDGLAPLRRQYGMDFREIVEVPVSERMGLYDRLEAGKLDVVLVHGADGGLSPRNLVLLRDDLDFFPSYEAAFLYRRAAAERFPALEGIFDRLAGVLDDERMRELSRRVVVRGEDPREVARSALISFGLLKEETVAVDRKALVLAVSLSANADGEAARALRALRQAFPSRHVQILSSSDPLGAVQSGDARLALVSAPAFFAPGSADPVTGQPPLRPGFEAVALIGTSYLQAFALDPGIRRIEEAGSIATGPVGSSGYRAAQSVIDGLGLSAELVPVQGDSPNALADALAASGADAAILMQPLGNLTVLNLLERGFSLIGIESWRQGNNSIVYPYLQRALLGMEEYAAFSRGDDGYESDVEGSVRAIPTLVTQLLLAGPAPPKGASIGSKGPAATYVPYARPLSDSSVRSLNEALEPSEEIYPVLPQARSLTPRLPQPPDPLNPSPGTSILTVFVVALLVWIAWLLVRPSDARGGR
jgi:glycine betaine/choline ABC-type transport system substrate-binding protein